MYIFKLSKNNNYAEVEIKHGGTRYTVLVGNQFSFDCSSLQLANSKTCHHIVWVLLNIMEVGEGNQLIAQVETGHVVLMQILSKAPTEIPHHISTIYNEDQKYNQILIQHSLFNRNHVWHLERKPTGTSYRCSGCLHPQQWPTFLYARTCVARSCWYKVAVLFVGTIH